MPVLTAEKTGARENGRENGGENGVIRYYGENGVIRYYAGYGEWLLAHPFKSSRRVGQPPSFGNLAARPDAVVRRLPAATGDDDRRRAAQAHGRAPTGVGPVHVQVVRPKTSRFLADPVEKVHRFMTHQGDRSHLEEAIRRWKCDVDMQTEKTRPSHTLVCTKNTNSFRAALEKYHEDVKRLEAVRLVENLMQPRSVRR